MAAIVHPLLSTLQLCFPGPPHQQQAVPCQGLCSVWKQVGTLLTTANHCLPASATRSKTLHPDHHTQQNTPPCHHHSFVCRTPEHVHDGRLPLMQQLQQFVSPKAYAAKVLSGHRLAWGKLGLPGKDGLFIADLDAAKSIMASELQLGVGADWPPTFREFPVPKATQACSAAPFLSAAVLAQAELQRLQCRHLRHALAVRFLARVMLARSAHKPQTRVYPSASRPLLTLSQGPCWVTLPFP